MVWKFNLNSSAIVSSSNSSSVTNTRPFGCADDPLTSFEGETAINADLGELLLIYICNFHVLSHLLLIYICKLHWNLNTTELKNKMSQVSAIAYSPAKTLFTTGESLLIYI